jgi:glycosyltransferase involved in cell wall biosynthesis
MVAPTSFFADYGCHVRILEEARILQKLGSQVTICTYHNGRNLPGLDIRRTMSIPWRKDYEVGSSRHKVAFDVLLFLRTAAAMFSARPDVIHAHLHEGALIGRLLSWLWRVPLVFDFQGSLTGEMLDHGFLRPDSRFFRLMRNLERRIDRACPHILTSSHNAAALLARDFGCGDGRITVAPDVVNTDVFAPAPRDAAWAQRKAAWGIPADRMVVVYLGLLAEYQGTGHLLEAARLICERRDDLHLLIAGYPHVDVYQRQAEALGLAGHVTFTGRVPYEEAANLLALGDIAVSPKLSRTEGAGKLLNYMAMGLPTVAFEMPVSREYLGDLGVYAAFADVADLARRLEALADDPLRRCALGEALRRRAQSHYAWDTCGETILDVYDRATGRA